MDKGISKSRTSKPHLIVAAKSRKRGRPTGQNRVPLSQDERKARNAQYERERRIEYANAMAELAEAMGFEQTMPNADLLSEVITFLKNRQGGSQSIEDLRRQNDLLSLQVDALSKQAKEN